MTAPLAVVKSAGVVDVPLQQGAEDRGHMLEPGSVSIASPTLVGRRPELATLSVAVARAERGQFSVVLIEGDAGIGKTRLVREL